MSTPKKPTSRPPKDTAATLTMLEDDSFLPKKSFSMQQVAALHLSTFACGFSNSERQAAARALLRHDTHADGTHYQTRRSGGLHPSYIGFNVLPVTEERTITPSEFTEASMKDIFDSVCVLLTFRLILTFRQLTMQDRLDGGISLMVHCPGFKAGRSLSPEQGAVDLYITPRELHENSARIGGDVAVLVQAFCEEFVIPHMQRFNERCRIENMEPPRRCEFILTPELKNY